MLGTFEDRYLEFRKYVWEKHGRSTIPNHEGLLIDVVFKEHPIYHGMIQMMVVVEFEMDIRELKRPEMMRWLKDIRGWLEEFQGALPNDREAELLNNLWDLLMNKMSDTDIARMLNTKIADALAKHVEVEQLRSESKLNIAEFMNYIEEMGYNQRSIVDGMLTMHYMGLSDEEVWRWRDEGIQNIKNGHPPFLPGQPIDRHRVRNRLRAWKQRFA